LDETKRVPEQAPTPAGPRRKNARLLDHNPSITLVRASMMSYVVPP